MWQCVTLTVQNGRQSSSDGEDDVLSADSMASQLPLDTGSASNASNSTTTLSDLQPGQFELCYYPSSFLLPSEVLPAFTASDRVMDVIVLDSAQHPMSRGMAIHEYSRMRQSMLLSLEDGLSSPASLPSGSVDPQQAAEVDGSAGSIRSVFKQLSLTSTPQPTSALLRAVSDTCVSPSVGLFELRRRALFWSSQTFPRRADRWVFEEPRVKQEKRTQHRLQLAREATRALAALLGLDYADVVDDISIPFQDCAKDQAHVDWPVLDAVFAAVYDVLQQKLACSCSVAYEH